MSVLKWNERPHQRMLNIKTPRGKTAAAVAMCFRTGAVLNFPSYTFSDTTYYRTFIQSIVGIAHITALNSPQVCENVVPSV